MACPFFGAARRSQSLLAAARTRTPRPRADRKPKVYFRALVKFTLALYRPLGDPNNFDRRHNRDEVLPAGAVPPVVIPLEPRAIQRYPYGGADGGSTSITVRLPGRDKM